ncbi:S-adenosyl-L-methionine-dependent methyltransferase [Arabidopsis thaliana x Arabidopsis arenosa]|uniref:S-adenosyl-L-methionine-dependent methyltransferase n=1 Tax=Arabidopsis thaliana x Arabidopsis arenosa TaxID=1240361 RepID=A0A8T2AEW5_9BRAS|nr:S-adenosyl-L-methionine-dependent methyltransferase [Arabidopsis thaliana x Arabidopsis arenosa]
MYSLSFPSSSFALLPSLFSFVSSRRLSLQPKKLNRLQSHFISPQHLSFSQSNVSPYRAFCVSPTSPPEGTVSVFDFHEKDWSFLESMEIESTEHAQKIERIIKAGEISESSRVLVSISSEAFVDRLVESSPTQLLLIVHDSLFTLACVKEKYDKVKCWQGELIYVPEKWSPLDVVFLYFLPALPFDLDDLFKTLSQRCSSGARVVISHPQGRQGLEQQRKEFSDVVVSDLPDDSTLRNVAKKHSFELTQFVDEQGLYLAVLKSSKQ